MALPPTAGMRSWIVRAALAIVAADGKDAKEPSAASSTDDSDAGHRIPYEIRPVPHKGIGVFAARALAAGERVIAEAPLARWCVAEGASEEAKLRSFNRMAETLDRARFDQLLSSSRNSTSPAPPATPTACELRQ